MTITSSLIHKQLMLAIAQQQLIVSPETSVMAAISMMGEMGASCAIVSGPEGCELMGIFTERDLVRICIQSVPLAQLTIQSVMSHPVITIQETVLNNINDVLILFQQHQVRHLPVLNGDRFMGVLTKDVLTEILAKTVLNSSEGKQKIIQESDRRYLNLATAAPVAIFRFDKIFNCIYVNDRWSEMTGRSPESALENGWKDALHPDDRDRLISQWTQDSNQVDLSSPVVINNEGRLLRPDGSINWFYVQIVPEIDDENQITGYIGTLMDITARKQAELELQKSEQRYRVLIDGVSDALLLANPQGNLIEANQKAEELLGYSRDELKSLHILNPDGSINWFYVPVVPEIDDENQITNYIGTIIDITVRKQAELELQKSEQRYRVLMNAASDAILLANPQGNLIEGNQKAEELLGYSRDELKSLHMSQIHPPETLEAARNHFMTVKQNNFAPALESLVLRKDGSQIPVEITGSRIDLDGVSIAQGIFRDIRDRKKTEAALFNIEKRYRALFNHKTDAVFINSFTETGKPSTFIEVNDTACEILGYSREELLTMNPSDIMPKDFFCDRAVIETLRTQKYVSSEVLHQTKDGRIFPVELNLVQLEDNEGKTLILATARDISDRKQAEAQLQTVNEQIKQSNDRLAQSVSTLERSNALLTVIQEASFDGILVIDEHRRVLTYNQQFIRQWHIPQEAIIEGDDRQLLTAVLSQLTNPTEFLELVEHLYENPQKISRDEISFIDGRTFDRCSAPIYWENKHYGRIWFFCDISDRKRAELSLQQELIRRNTVFNASSDGIHILDVEGNLLEYNDRFAQILGYTPAEIVGFNVAEWDAQWTPEELQEVLRMNFYNDDIFETLHRRKDGSIFPVEISRRAMEWQGKLALVNISRDISERKQAEQALRESQTFIQKIADASPNILYLYDIQEQRNIYTNREILSVLGYAPEAIQAMGSDFVLNIMHPDDINHVLPKYYEKVIAAQDGEIIESEYRMRHANGEWRWLSSRDIIFSRDAEGRVKQTLGTAEDISDRKRFQQEQNRLISILEASTDYISMSDAQGTIFWKNAELKRLCGIDPDHDIKQFKISDCHPHWAAELVLQEGIPHAIATGSWIGETALFNAGGEEIPISQLILSHKSPQGEIEFFSFIMRDMRVRREYEQKLEQTNAELLRATRLKDEFLATMSHELRTPLNAILGMTEALQEEIFGILNERQIKALQTVEGSSNHLLELINDILDVAKIEAGQVELSYGLTAIDQLCQSSMTFIKQQAFQKHIQFEMQIAPNLPDISIDERRIRQVLINLLSNAVKFTPEGGQIRLEVDRQEDRTSSDNSAWLCFLIIDTGIGIAPENVPKLFQPFIQIDSALNRNYAGTGLGLTLVKQIVDLHGGKVSLTSELGVGSCFSIELPYISHINPSSEISPSDRSITTSEPDLPNQNTLQSPLILLAEDNEANIMTISSYLTAKGYRLVLAGNGEEAIAMAMSAQPDLILMDIQMPVMDGLEATKQIRQIPSLVNVPIIALTALAMEPDRDRCIAAGANEYLAKPVRLKQLSTIIQQLLATQQDRQ